MENVSGSKITRILDLYTKLMNGYLISKSEEAERYGVNERSIQRDIDDIRSYLSDAALEHGFVNSVVYDRTEDRRNCNDTGRFENEPGQRCPQFDPDTLRNGDTNL